MATKKTAESKPTKTAQGRDEAQGQDEGQAQDAAQEAATVPKMEDVAKAKGKQEFVKVARTKNKKKPAHLGHRLQADDWAGCGCEEEQTR